MTTNTEIKLIQGNKLHKLVKENKTADALAHYLAARMRIRGFTDLKRLNMDLVREEKFDINEEDSERFFKSLEAEGLGSIVYPRALGGRARFLWKYDMRKVANAAIEGKDTYAEELPLKMQRTHDGSRKPKPSKPQVLINKVLVPENKPQKPVTNTPDQVIINGETFVCISQDEFHKLNKFKDLLKQLGK